MYLAQNTHFNLTSKQDSFHTYLLSLFKEDIDK
jgi:hypothetical protein